VSTPWERYSHPELAAIWYTPEAVGAFVYQHRVLIQVALVQEWMNLIKKGTGKALQKVEVNLERILQIQKEGENHQTRAYLRMVQEKMRENGDEEFLSEIFRLMTSYDLWDTGLGLMLPESAKILIQDLEGVEQELERLAVEHRRTLMIGRSHGIHGRPITFGKKCLDWLEKISFAKNKLEEAEGKVKVGKLSGAMGIYSQNPRVEEWACAELGLTPASVSTQIIDRIIYADFFNAVTLVMCALEAIALNIREGQRTERREWEEPFDISGSNAMPHKRNPEKCERICGLARKVRADQAVLYENITTWEERSLEQSSPERLIFPEMLVLTGYCARLMKRVLRGLVIYPEQMRRNLDLTNGAIYAEDLKDALQQKGVPQIDAYDWAKEVSQRAYWGEGELVSNSLQHLKISEYLSKAELMEICNPESALRYIDQIYARFAL
jgi:adenylosuccinate lyase